MDEEEEAMEMGGLPAVQDLGLDLVAQMQEIDCD